MNADQVIAELKQYERELSRILANFTHRTDAIRIGRDDDPLLHQYVMELIDLFNDSLGDNAYSRQIAGAFNLGPASYKCVEGILSTVRASLTRLERSPDLLARRQAEDALRHRENVFIIHGRDEAKWRELKEILKSEFRLNPIVLSEQPDTGCKTLIEKFEHYAQTCTYAIAVFTPDDEVTFKENSYVQARPNVIYELGWFCGKLGRSGAMLLLKNGTSVFSDFGGIVQKRFEQDVSEKLQEIRRDLVVAGVLSPS